MVRTSILNSCLQHLRLTKATICLDQEDYFGFDVSSKFAVDWCLRPFRVGGWYQIEGLQGISPVHQSFPWRVVQCLDPASWTTVLKDMKEIWQFTTEFADTLRQNDALFNELQVTRFQNFRDTMTKAEQLVLKLRIFSTSFFFACSDEVLQ